MVAAMQQATSNPHGRRFPATSVPRLGNSARTLAAAFVVALTATTTATAAAPPRLVAAADAVVAAGGPGVVVYVRDHAKTTVVTRGYADLATKRPANARDHFRVGSVTKSFVASIVLQLSVDHKLALDDSVAKYLPGLVPNGKAITLRELLWARPEGHDLRPLQPDAGAVHARIFEALRRETA